MARQDEPGPSKTGTTEGVSSRPTVRQLQWRLRYSHVTNTWKSAWLWSLATGCQPHCRHRRRCPDARPGCLPPRARANTELGRVRGALPPLWGWRDSSGNPASSRGPYIYHLAPSGLLVGYGKCIRPAATAVMIPVAIRVRCRWVLVWIRARSGWGCAHAHANVHV